MHTPSHEPTSLKLDTEACRSAIQAFLECPVSDPKRQELEKEMVSLISDWFLAYLKTFDDPQSAYVNLRGVLKVDMGIASQNIQDGIITQVYHVLARKVIENEA